MQIEQPNTILSSNMTSPLQRDPQSKLLMLDLLGKSMNPNVS